MTSRPILRRARMLVLGAAIALLVPLLPLGAAAHAHRDAPNNACDAETPTSDFNDRDEIDEVHRANVDCLAALEVTVGRDGPTGLEYAPDASVLRGQMATFVARSLEAAGHELPAPTDQGFTDISGNTHEDRINQLAEIGVVLGRTETRYAPDEGVRRDQMATYLMRAASWAHGSPYGPVAGPYFADIDGNVHGDHIDAAYELWVVNGRSSAAYAPGAVVERGAMGSFLARFIDLVHPDNFLTGNQTYVVAPQEAITATAGDPVDFSVGFRYDDEPFTGPVEIALLPCENAEPTDSPVVFADTDDDGLADDFASTTGGEAYISAVNEQANQAPVLHFTGALPTQDGALDFTVVSPTADCAVIVVFDGRVQDGLRLDAGQRPAGPFGVGKVTWE